MCKEDMIGLDRIACRAECGRPVHHHGVGADALDPRAERSQKMREILDVRLGGRVAQVGGALRRHRRDQRVFGRGDAGFVEEDVGAL
jgi:hypothetical protein